MNLHIKIYFTIFLTFVVLLPSCSINSKKSRYRCYQVDEVPSYLKSLEVIPRTDTSYNLQITIHSEEDSSTYSYSKCMIYSSEEFFKGTFFKDDGVVRFNLEDGIYKVNCKGVNFPEITIDSVIVSSNKLTQLFIEKGTSGGFVTVQMK